MKRSGLREVLVFFALWFSLRGIGGCKKYPRGVKGGKSRYLDLEREGEGRRDSEYGIVNTGSLDIPIYIIYILFLVSKM